MQSSPDTWMYSVQLAFDVKTPSRARAAALYLTVDAPRYWIASAVVECNGRFSVRAVSVGLRILRS